MKKLNNHESRNFGYGKQLAFAGKQALLDRYGEGRFATQASHYARFKQFADWCKNNGIRDARKIDSDIISAFANSLSERVNNNSLSVSYAQNQLSTVNVVLSTMRGDKSLVVSPSSLVGERSHIRQSVPLSLSRERYELAHQKLLTVDSKLTLAFAREFGMRLREAALFRPMDAVTECFKKGGFNIHRGVKGGRQAKRFITPNSRQLQLLSHSQQVLGHRALVDRVGNYAEWKNRFYREYENSGAHGVIGKYHDNRAAFACEMYKKITGSPAPVVAGKRLISRERDKDARLKISLMLGHGRIDVVSQYIGSMR
ncbi:hypothetical protein AAEU28_11855 [Pseudoalteromonas sp. SS15]|uniref:hypothetical protein n=1 Tax=Pseudoalteromonas sp. SS15 TaxID=3139393 RepID=UPI003BABAD1B